MAKLDEDKYFTKIDLTKGYWQIPKTTFTTPDGCLRYQFKRMPLGLVNSVATFNHMMRKLLDKMHNKGCIDHYVDDVLAHTMDWESHVSSLRELFGHIRAAGLTI